MASTDKPPAALDERKWHCISWSDTGSGQSEKTTFCLVSPDTALLRLAVPVPKDCWIDEMLVAVNSDGKSPLPDNVRHFTMEGGTRRLRVGDSPPAPVRPAPPPPPVSAAAGVEDGRRYWEGQLREIITCRMSLEETKTSAAPIAVVAQEKKVKEDAQKLAANYMTRLAMWHDHFPDAFESPRKHIILDVDDTLLTSTKSVDSVHLRPGLRVFFHKMFAHPLVASVSIWTASQGWWREVWPLVHACLPPRAHFFVVWEGNRCSRRHNIEWHRTDVEKRLSKLWRRRVTFGMTRRNTIIVDDTATTFANNRGNALKIAPFNARDMRDDELARIWHRLEQDILLRYDVRLPPGRG